MNTNPHMTGNLNKFRLIKILSTFDEKEINDFEKYLESPLHNNFKTLVKLFKILKPYHPHFKNNMPDRKSIFLKVSGAKAFNDMLFNKYMSDLSKLAEEFIVHLEFKDQHDEKNICLLNYYRKKDVNDLFNQTLHRIEKNKATDHNSDNHKFLNKHKIEHIKGEFYFRTQKPLLEFGSLISSQDNLLKYFLGLSTYHYRSLFVHKYSFKNYAQKNSINEFWNNFDFENFIKNSDLKKHDKDLLTLNYYNVMLSLKENDFSIYRKMKHKIMDCYKDLSKQTLYELYSSLNSHCIVKIAYGHTNLEQELFNNFKFMIEEKLYELGNENNINITEYRAILRSALRVNETDWLEYFINNYRDFIEANTRDVAYQYGNAFLLSAKGKYSESLKLTSNLKVLNHSMRIDLYFLTLMNYYELEYYDIYNTVIDSFKHYLKENKYVSNELSKGYIKFLYFYKILIRLKKNPDEKKINNLLVEISGFKGFLGDNKWLLTKVNELLNAVRSDDSVYYKAKKAL